MINPLSKLWCKRFLQVALLLSITLAVSERFKTDSWDIDLLGIVLWALLIAVFVASLSSYWAYKKRCKLVYKD